MAEEEIQKKKEENTGIGPQDGWMNRPRNVLLAALGVYATIEENGKRLIDSLAEKRREQKKNSRRQLDKAYERLQKSKEEVSGRMKEFVDSLDERLEPVLDRIGIANRKEIEDLMGKVEKLSAEVHKLSLQLEKQKERQEPPPPPPENL